FDAGERRRAGATGITADQDVIGLRLCNTRGDGADADFADELHAHTTLWVHALEIVNELRQIFNRVNVMMRRRGDQTDARRAVADLADVFVHLVPRELPAFAGLGALGHLDLQLVAVHEILRRHA